MSPVMSVVKEQHVERCGYVSRFRFAMIASFSPVRLEGKVCVEPVVEEAEVGTQVDALALDVRGDVQRVDGAVDGLGHVSGELCVSTFSEKSE